MNPTFQRSLLFLMTWIVHPVIGETMPHGAELTRQLKQTTLVRQFEPAPEFTCRATDGRNFSLAGLKGKVVVLYFFSTSVGACVTELQRLEEEIVAKVKNRNDFLLLAVGRGHSREELVNLAGVNKLTFPLIADTDQAIYMRFYTRFIPRLVVIRKDGVVASLMDGYRDFEGIPSLQAVLTRELGQKPAGN